MIQLSREVNCVNCGKKYKTYNPTLWVKYNGRRYGLDLCTACAMYSVIDLNKLIKACTKRTKGWDVIIKKDKKK